MRIGGRRWRRVRLAVLARDGYVCRLRIPEVCTIAATTVDHIVPIRDRPDLEFNPRNLRASCQPCNQYRGARQIDLMPGPGRSPRWLDVFR